MVLIAATENEIGITSSWLNTVNVPPTLREGDTHQREIGRLITGVGSVATAYSLAKYLAANKPDLVIQAGIGGSFDPSLQPGSVVVIGEDLFADLGAIENNEIVDIFDLGLSGDNETPFTDRMLVNPLSWSKFGLPVVRGATVNRISSDVIEVEIIKNKYHASVESMEGAALHYVCLKENIPFLQIRAISNYCGERNKSNWKLTESIVSLNDVLKRIITELS